MILWEDCVPHMLEFGFFVLCRLHSIVIHIVMGSLWQHMRLFYGNKLKLIVTVAGLKQFLTNK